MLLGQSSEHCVVLDHDMTHTPVMKGSKVVRVGNFWQGLVVTQPTVRSDATEGTDDHRVNGIQAQLL